MKTIDSFPRRVREIENLFIPLSDGCRLAARIRRSLPWRDWLA